MDMRTQDKVGDLAYDAATALLSAVPGFGPIAAYIFSQLVQSPFEERREAWMKSVTDNLMAIEQRQSGFIESLKDNVEFLDILFQANNIAMRNSQESKLVALKNAVIHSATEFDINYSVKLMYLRLVDELTPFHFMVLKFLNDPDQHFIENNIRRTSYIISSFRTTLSEASPEFKKNANLINIIVRDMNRMGLISIDNVDTMSGNQGSVSTAFGKDFINFVN
jgi:hypothetical protein